LGKEQTEAGMKDDLQAN